MELANQIHKYLIGVAIISAFVHFVYLFFKALKNQPFISDFNKSEITRVVNEYKQDYFRKISIFLKPFLVLLLWIFCIFGYFITALTFGIIW